MTLEQTTDRILAAAEAQNLEMLQEAGKERESAISAIKSLPPTEALRHAVATSLAAGAEAKRSLHVIKQRMRNESRRLAQIENGFVRALRPVPAHEVDCKG